jgi:hypothetical protein
LNNLSVATVNVEGDLRNTLRRISPERLTSILSGLAFCHVNIKGEYVGASNICEMYDSGKLQEQILPSL